MHKIGLMGFGRAGKAVANVILQHPDFSLDFVLRKGVSQEYYSVRDFIGVKSDDPALIYSIEHIDIDTFLDDHHVDFIIDFSSEESIFYYGESAADRHIKLISAISHYDENTLQFLKRLSQKTVMFWSPNITLGVNFLILAGKILRKIAPWADVEIIEEHFRLKKGVSGTALKIAEILHLDDEQINSIRVGGIVGRHEVIFGFPYQTVRLIHESVSREAFGNGALFVASHLRDKETGYYSFEDLLGPYFQGDENDVLS